MVLGGVEMADQLAVLPQVQAVAGRLGDDHRPVVGPLRVDRPQVERHLRRRRRADDQGGAGPAGDDRPVDVAGDHRDDVGPSLDHRAQPGDPLGVRISVSQPMPVAIGGWWSAIRVGRSGASSSSRSQSARISQKPPWRPTSSVSRTRMQRPVLDRILDEALDVGHFGEQLEERGPAVVIAHQREDREGEVGERLAVALVGLGVVAVIGDVAGDQQQIGLRRQRPEPPASRRGAGG